MWRSAELRLSACKGCKYNDDTGIVCPRELDATCPKKGKRHGLKKGLIRLALVGNANVGKSVIFNQMTGLDQTTGNWAGKTVELARGKAIYRRRLIEIVDLPGVYSLSSYSEEEQVTRDFITSGEVDVVLDVIDSTALERNLYLTTQLLELDIPVVVLLNQSDLARKKGLRIRAKKLSKVLGVPVVKTVGLTGQGLRKAIGKALALAKRKKRRRKYIKYGPEVESRVGSLQKKIKKPVQGFSPRFLASKILEGDEVAATLVASRFPRVLKLANTLQEELSEIHGEDSATVMTSERYSISHRISNSVTRTVRGKRLFLSDTLDKWTTHPVAGYMILALLLLGMFFVIFTIGDHVSGWLIEAYQWGGGYMEELLGTGWVYKVVWDGGAQGFIAAIAFVLPYILPFYLILALLEDSGYLSRVAVLMDALMHKFGLHGKAFIPMVLGYGCSVPAVLGTRILDTKRERFIAAFLSTLMPCAARTIVIMALVGAFLGWYWALGFYVFNALIILILGQVTTRLMPGKAYGLIMEVPQFHTPHLKIVLKQSWMRLKDFVVVAIPFVVIGSITLVLFEIFNITDPVNWVLKPITVWTLGLPAVVGVILLLGILRKELTVVMLVAIWGTASFYPEFMTWQQLVVFTVFVMFYIPCVSTMAALFKEFGLRATVTVSAVQFILAIAIAGAFHLIFVIFT
jgi:ferrous iron transport protein B